MEHQLPTQATQKEQPVKAPSSSPVQSSSAVTLHPVLRLQRAVGNQVVQRLVNSGKLQAKLKVNQPGDAYEQEADQVAEQVIRAEPSSSMQRSCACDGIAGPNGECEACAAKRKALQRKAAHPEPAAPAPSLVTDVLNSSSGRPLDNATRSFMESRFEQDFSNIRVHTDQRAAESAQAVNAKAYTVGQDVVFGAGQYTPETSEGKRLVAHELTHVIQQQAAMPIEHRSSGVSNSRKVQPSAVSAMALQREENDPRKLEVERIDTPRHVRVSEWLVESKSGADSERTELYWAEFEVDAKGVMRASVRTVSPDRIYRSRVLRFGAEFRRALEHFKECGVEVTEFEGDWSYMSKDEISDNLKVFLESLAQGGTREKAAEDTPTGRVLAKEGFKVTHVENVLESQPHLAEEGVSRWRVKARFRRLQPGSVTPSGGIVADPPVPESTTTAAPRTGLGQFRSGPIAVAGAVGGILAVIEDILGPLSATIAMQADNIRKAEEEYKFWSRYAPPPIWGIWDERARKPLAQDTLPRIALLGSPYYLYIKDINVDAFQKRLPNLITTYQAFIGFLELAQQLGTVVKEGEHYFALANKVDPSNEIVYDVTATIEEIRTKTLSAGNEQMRTELGKLSPSEMENIFRLKSGSKTQLFRTKDEERIVSAERFLGPDPWVRKLGPEVGGGLFAYLHHNHYGARVLVAPANGDALQAAVNSAYRIEKGIEKVLDEVSESSRSIRSKSYAPLNPGRLEGFVAGPDGDRFGSTRYQRDPNFPNNWTIAIGELKKFYVNADELVPISPENVKTYVQSSPS